MPRFAKLRDLVSKFKHRPTEIKLFWSLMEEMTSSIEPLLEEFDNVTRERDELKLELGKLRRKVANEGTEAAGSGGRFPGEPVGHSVDVLAPGDTGTGDGSEPGRDGLHHTDT